MPTSLQTNSVSSSCGHVLATGGPEAFQQQARFMIYQVVGLLIAEVGPEAAERVLRTAMRVIPSLRRTQQRSADRRFCERSTRKRRRRCDRANASNVQISSQNVSVVPTSHVLSTVNGKFVMVASLGSRSASLLGCAELMPNLFFHHR